MDSKRDSKREHWSSKLGFILATAGSAIGLANIWRFPYMVGKNGGAAFIAIYLVCLLLIGFPVFISEILIGKKGQKNPFFSFRQLGGAPLWGKIGGATILTGFLVSSFYSAVAGWVLGYLIEALSGSLKFNTTEQASLHWISLTGHPLWAVTFHFLFMFACVVVLYLGVKKGIERGNKIMMPLLFIILIGLVIKGLTLPNSWEALAFLLKPDWSLLTPVAFLGALGHSFFTLSLGQGTMVTYGSYMDDKEPILSSCVPVALMDTMVSILAAFAIFTIAFSQGIEPDSGPGLLFHTLPFVFSELAGGQIVAVLFFLLVTLAALTSEISAMEPSIAYLMEVRGWGRHKATFAVGLFAFLLGIPSALSAALGIPFLDYMDFLCSAILIPLGGLAAVLLVGWFMQGNGKSGKQVFELQVPGMRSSVRHYLALTIKFTAPILILLVFLNALGIL